MPPSDRLPITGDAVLDGRIWEIAIDRGYLLRPVAGPDLGVPTACGCNRAAAWLELELEAARAAGHRSSPPPIGRPTASEPVQLQAEGTTDEAIDAALRWYSIPGTSKHHSGYALDFRYADGTFAEFRDTPDYAWLAADNFHNAKRFGFILPTPTTSLPRAPTPSPGSSCGSGST